ncbi:MAG: sigma-70 family RNA polymerase sigma factor [Planctomycetota bacterium]
MTDSRLDSTTLADQRECLVRLAQALGADEHAAEDLAQEAWLVFLRRPPRSAERLRGWLASVLRSRLLNARRAEERRRAHESEAHRGSAENAETDAGRVLEVQERMVQALRRLDEPYREALFLRYYDGLGPTAIARRQGVPLATVKSRLKRGLQRLRDELDERCGHGWLAALAPLCESRRLVWPKAVQATAGALLMKKLTLTLLALPAVLGALWWWNGSGPAADPRAVALDAAESDGDGALQLAEPPPAAAPSDPARTLLADPSTAERAETGTGRATAPSVRGRVLLADGGPAAGCAVVLSASQPFSSAAAEPIRAQIPAGDDGVFELALDAPEESAFLLHIAHPRYVEERRAWVHEANAGVHDVGDVVLEPAGSITGRVIDASGAPLVEGVELFAHRTRGSRTAGELDPATGAFRVDGLRAGNLRVTARHTTGRKVERVVEVVPFTEAEVELVFDPSPSRRLVVGIVGSHRRSLDLPASSITLHGAASGPRHPRRSNEFTFSSTQDYVFEDLGEDVYRIEISAPRCAPWSRDGVRPGTRVSAVLDSSCGVRLEVTDSDGARVERWSVAVDYDAPLPGVWVGPTALPLIDAGDEPPDGGIVRGVFPGDMRLFVEAPDHGSGEVLVRGLRAGELRDVAVELASERPLEGRVVLADGATPAAGVDVQLTRGDKPGRTRRQAPFGSGLIVSETTTSDADGRFAFAAKPGTWTVRALWSERLHATQTVVLGQAELNVVLRRPASGSLVADVLLPEVDPRLELKLAVTSDPSSARGSVRIEKDGPVSLGEQPAGEHGFQLSIMQTGVLGRTCEVGRVTVEAGRENEVLLDLRATCPGALDFSLRAGGAPVTGGALEASPEGHESALLAFAGVEESGTGSFGPMTPGWYRLAYRAPGQRWAWEWPDLVEVLPGAVGSVELGIDLVERTLRVLDPMGTPAAATKIRVKTAVGSRLVWGSTAMTTDATGRATLTLPAGAARVVVKGHEPVDVDWRAGEGELEVRLTPADD